MLNTDKDPGSFYLQVVIHLTDGVDGDLADLQRASEELRQEGGFWGFLNGREMHCQAGEK